eukprot:COSAG01_NODE_61230_length_290_cov_1.350785_1_plen_82_part_01
MTPSPVIRRGPSGEADEAYFFIRIARTELLMPWRLWIFSTHLMVFVWPLEARRHPRRACRLPWLRSTQLKASEQDVRWLTSA